MAAKTTSRMAQDKAGGTTGQQNENEEDKWAPNGSGDICTAFGEHVRRQLLHVCLEDWGVGDWVLGDCK
ncbi:hypothetical protein ACLKA7_013895 [Drosophila subpalustris]